MQSEFRLSFEREVDVPAERLYAGWTDPDMILKWFTPAPWKTKKAIIEMRPGGAYESVMESPEGMIVENRGAILDFTENRHFVFTNLMTRDFTPKAIGEGEFGFVGKLDFEPRGKGALYRASVDHQDEAGMKLHEGMGFEAGWNMALDQLVALIKSEG